VPQGRGRLTCEGNAPGKEWEVELFRSLPMKAYIALVSMRDREEGQALVEYALLLALIAVVSIGILTTLGTNVSTIFSKVNAKL
jgi:pilus assembly protein Flp/PilA